MEEERRRAEEKRQRADEERRKAEAERRRADEERRKAEAERRKADDEKFRKAEEKRQKAQAERERRLDARLDRLTGDADNRWGRLMEALVEENLLRLLRKADINVIWVASRVRSQLYGEWREYDLVAVGESDAVVVEVKTTLEAADVGRFVRRIRDFREWRPDYARARVRGAFAYLTRDQESAQSAEAAGFHLIQAVSGSARLVNSKDFRPSFF